MGPKGGRLDDAAGRRRRHGRANLFVCLLSTLVSLSWTCEARGAFDGVIDTYVGGGNGDGAAATDALTDPRGLVIASDPARPDTYIADGRNHRVRRVDAATGIIVTVAGTGESGFSGDGGLAQNAKLSLPMDVAVDAAGNVFIADYNNNRIRKVTPSGIISTFAGTGSLSYGGDNGLATQAALSNPWGVAVGPDGYVYIADFGNNRIRRVGPPGCTPQTCIISTVVGNGTWGYGGDNGPASSAVLRNPADIAFDASGNMLIADWGNHVVRRVVNGTIQTIAGGGSIGSSGSIGDGGPAVGSVLRYPTQVVANAAGAVYIADSLQRRLRKVQDGIITTAAGTGAAGSAGDGGPATQADMNLTYGVAVHAAGDVWVATTTDLARSQHNRVRRVDTRGIIEAVVGGGLGDGAAASDVLVDPRGSEARVGTGLLPDLYFADGANNVVRYVDGSDGRIHVLAGSGEAGYTGDGGWATQARLNKPLDVAVDHAGNVYIADTSNNVIRRVDRGGLITTVAGTGQRGFTGDGGPATAARLAAPTGVAVDRNGYLYIADYDNYRVRRVVNGTITTFAGNGQYGWSGDGGEATAAMLRNPWDIVLAADGTMFIADTFNQRIRKVAPNGVISTYAGTGFSGFTGDGGAATAARLNSPSLLALDAANNLFITDSENRRIRVIAAQSGIIDTVAGNGQSGSSGDGGAARSASFSTPSGVAVDPNGGFLFVAANNDGRVRMVAFSSAPPPPSPTFTSTAIPPTNTATSAPASATRTPTSTRTPTITQTPTRTATATRTATGAAANGSVTGRVTYYSNQSAVPGARVDLTGPESMSGNTNSAGNYAVNNVALGNWAVSPMKEGGVGGSVSSLDAARVLQVIAGMTTFTPLQRLACDVTGDGNLSALDAVRILQYSAGVINRLPLAQTCGSDWLFYPTPDPFQFQQITSPLMGGGGCQGGSITLTLTSIFNLAPNQNFSGLVIGDCTGNWTTTAGAFRTSSGSSSVAVHAGSFRAAPGGRRRLPLYVQSATPFSAVDVQLAYDPTMLTVRAVRPYGLARRALLGIGDQEPGVLTISLASEQPIRRSAGAVLLVEFSTRPRTDGRVALRHAQVDEQPARVVTHSR